MKSLLEEQKELIKDVLGQHKKGAEHDLEIIMSRIQLSKLFSRYWKDNWKVVLLTFLYQILRTHRESCRGETGDQRGEHGGGDHQAPEAASD